MKTALERRTRRVVRAVFIAVLMVAGAKRSDGWPLCPGCGEDELFSLAFPLPLPTDIVGCYRCGWRLD